MDADVLMAKLSLVRPDTPVYIRSEAHEGERLDKPIVVTLARVEQNKDGEMIVEATPSNPGFEYNAIVIST